MEYSLKDYRFKIEEFFPARVKDMITEIRVNKPEIVRAEALARIRREKLTSDGRLTILAADHPARRVTNAGDDPIAMANRIEYLGRVLRVIAASDFDGVMGPTALIEELFIVNYLVKQGGGPSFLDRKVILGCMNRGGLAGTAWEMDDRFTSFTAESIHNLRLDGAKMMFRLEPDEPECLDTMEYCVEAINELHDYGIPVFLEPVPVKYSDGKYKTVKDAAELAKIACVASELGKSSMNIWLKMPYSENYEIVVRATSLPILMLGGEAKGDPRGILEEFAAGMRAGANVRGALVGRNILFPGEDDPMATAMAVHRIVHEGYTAEQAIEYLMEQRGKNLDALTRWIK